MCKKTSIKEVKEAFKCCLLKWGHYSFDKKIPFDKEIPFQKYAIINKRNVPVEHIFSFYFKKRVSIKRFLKIHLKKNILSELFQKQYDYLNKNGAYDKGFYSFAPLKNEAFSTMGCTENLFTCTCFLNGFTTDFEVKIIDDFVEITLLNYFIVQ